MFAFIEQMFNLFFHEINLIFIEQKNPSHNKN